MPHAVMEDLKRFGPEQSEALSEADALAYTRRLASASRENFHVITRLLPARLRDDFANTYAFCRWADDLGDEVGDEQTSLRLLQWWDDQLLDCFAGRARHPVFVALRRTVERHDLPIAPFRDLLSAFRQDQHTRRYDSCLQLLDYCARSANPVGRLVLMICGHREEHLLRLSDATCTGLQFVNFWQDVRRDASDRGRVYVPADVAQRHGLDIDDVIRAVRGSKEAERAIRVPLIETTRELCAWTATFFHEGRKVLSLVSPDARPAITLFTLGGEAVLNAIRRRGFDIWTNRPTIGRLGKLRILIQAWAAAAMRRTEVVS